MSSECLLRDPSRSTLDNGVKSRDTSRVATSSFGSGKSSLTRDSARDSARGRYHLVTDVLFDERVL